MPRVRQVFYIASEMEETERPCRLDCVSIKRGGG